MALIEKELAVLAVGAAAAASPRVRDGLRKGAAYGLAGAMKVGEVAVATGRGAVEGAQAGISGSPTRSSNSRKRTSGQKRSRPASAGSRSPASTSAT
jgi:hypothetical protein